MNPVLNLRRGSLPTACSALALSLVIAGAVMAVPARAQMTPMPAASTAAPVSPSASMPASSPAKRDLAQRFVVLQQPAVEGLVRNLVEGPARQIMAAGEPVLQTRIAADKREAVIKQVQEEVRKYVDSALPLVRDRAGKLSTTALLPAVEEKFTEDELRQIVTFLESPTHRKLQQSLPEMSQALTQKLVADSRAQIDPKVKTLETAVAKALGVPLNAAGPAAAPAAGARGTNAPAGSGMTLPGSRTTPLGKPERAASRP